MGRPIAGRWASSPGFSAAAPATCPGALRARMRRCRLPIASPSRSSRGGESESNRARCPPRVLRGGDRRTRRGPLRRADRDQARADRAVCPWPRRRRPGRARGHGQRLGDQAHHRAPRRRVIVVSPTDTGIRGARAKTDRLDARTLAKLLAAGELDSVWVPDRSTWRMRRRLQRRRQLVWQRSRAENQIHATLMRCLIGRAPFREPFGAKGRRWLSELALPEEERESVDSALRQIDFLDSEIAAVERLIAVESLDSPEAKRLMTVPGVNVICAATFIAAVGDIGRFASARRLVGYLGLDPRVSQSGTAPATHGRSSEQGSVAARHALVVASWSVVRQPGPMHAFYQRIRARRGHSVA